MLIESLFFQTKVPLRKKFTQCSEVSPLQKTALRKTSGLQNIYGDIESTVVHQIAGRDEIARPKKI
jgi:hypothetical protein